MLMLLFMSLYCANVHFKINTNYLISYHMGSRYIFLSVLDKSRLLCQNWVGVSNRLRQDLPILWYPPNWPIVEQEVGYYHPILEQEAGFHQYGQETNNCHYLTDKLLQVDGYFLTVQTKHLLSNDNKVIKRYLISVKKERSACTSTKCSRNSPGCHGCRHVEPEVRDIQQPSACTWRR